MKTIKAALRGLFKSVPGGNVAVSVYDNIKKEQENKNHIADGPMPHSWVSIVFQVIGLIAICYAFITHSITLDYLLSLIGFGVQ